MQRVGIYPGTFDPVHQGHVAFALAAARVCALDQVMFLPERVPREKLGVGDFAGRVAQLQAAVQPEPRLDLLVLDDQQFNVTQTLPQLQLRFAGAQLTLLVGSDVVQTFAHRWPGLDELLAVVDLAVGLRSGDSVAAVERVLAQLPARYVLVDTPFAAVSSSQIRDQRQ